jgi:membrane protease subunit HflC
MKPSEEPSVLQLIFRYGKWGILLIIMLIVFSMVGSCYFSVNQNELAGVTSYGSLVSDKPIGPGLHFKMPWQEVHTIRISIDKIPIDKIQVKTTDNQFVEVDLNLTYQTADPFKALFQVGAMGSGDVIDKVIPFVKSRCLDVFGQVNALQIVDQKKALENNILQATQASALEFFGEKIEDVQITHIGYSEGFEQNIEKMVQTRNEQTSAQNMLVVKQTEAQQVVAVAKGEADSVAAAADGAKRAAVAKAEGEAAQIKLQAEAEAYARKLKSEAEANAIKILGDSQGSQLAAAIRAAGSAENYTAILRAQASKQWTGQVPSIQLSGDKGGGSPILVLPEQVQPK